MLNPSSSLFCPVYRLGRFVWVALWKRDGGGEHVTSVSFPFATSSKPVTTAGLCTLRTCHKGETNWNTGCENALFRSHHRETDDTRLRRTRAAVFETGLVQVFPITPQITPSQVCGVSLRVLFASVYQIRRGPPLHLYPYVLGVLILLC